LIEEMFLTAFLFEEAKHTGFFSRWLREVAGSPKLPAAPEPSIQVFDIELPNAMNTLLEDPSPISIARVRNDAVAAPIISAATATNAADAVASKASSFSKRGERTRSPSLSM